MEVVPLDHDHIQVAILDDHPIVREGLRRFLSGSMDMTVCAEASSLSALLPQLQRQPCQVLLLDLMLEEGENGVTAFDEIMQRWPETRVIILTSYADQKSLDYLRQHGARGYLDKAVQPDDLAATIRQVARGRQVFDDLLKDSSTSAAMTTREQQVLNLIAEGLSNKEIGDALGIREKTVKVHVSHILAKLNVYDRTQAVIMAHQQGLVHLGDALSPRRPLRR